MRPGLFPSRRPSTVKDRRGTSSGRRLAEPQLFMVLIAMILRRDTRKGRARATFACWHANGSRLRLGHRAPRVRARWPSSRCSDRIALRWVDRSSDPRSRGDKVRWLRHHDDEGAWVVRVGRPPAADGEGVLRGGHRSRAGGYSWRGRRTVNVAPCSTPALAAEISPPCASTSAFAMASPMPEPPRRRSRLVSAR